jgi:hypothetical protein
LLKALALFSLLFSINLFAGTAMVKGEGATVHKEPDFKSLVLFRLKKNTAVEVSDTSYFGWHNTTVQGKKGYVHVSQLVLNFEGAKTVLEKSNPFDLDKKPIVNYFFDAAATPVGIAGQQIYSGFNFSFGYEGSSFERGFSISYGTGMGSYKIKVATMLLDFGWKFTRYTTIGLIGGYEFLKFSSLSVQKSPKDGKAYRSALDPRGFVVGGFLNQKIEGVSYSFILTQGALLETYDIDNYANSKIYYDNPVKETKSKVKPRIYIFASFGIRFYL